MARKRMIDPEFWSDEEIGRWSFQARLFYIGLWNFADDEGRFKAHNSLLKSQIFPYDSKINMEKLKQEINSKIQWYEINGAMYGFIKNFLKYQKIDRPQASKLPPPPFGDNSANNQRMFGEGSLNNQGIITDNSTNNQRTIADDSLLSQVNIKEVNISQSKSKEGKCEGKGKKTDLKTDFLNFSDCKTDLTKILDGLPIKDQEILLLKLCDGLKARTRCISTQKCVENLRAIMEKVKKKKPNNLYGYVKQSIDNFLHGK